MESNPCGWFHQPAAELIQGRGCFDLTPVADSSSQEEISFSSSHVSVGRNKQKECQEGISSKSLIALSSRKKVFQEETISADRSILEKSTKSLNLKSVAEMHGLHTNYKDYSRHEVPKRIEIRKTLKPKENSTRTFTFPEEEKEVVAVSDSKTEVKASRKTEEVPSTRNNEDEEDVVPNAIQQNDAKQITRQFLMQCLENVKPLISDDNCASSIVLSKEVESVGDRLYRKALEKRERLELKVSANRKKTRELSIRVEKLKKTMSSSVTVRAGNRLYKQAVEQKKRKDAKKTAPDLSMKPTSSKSSSVGNRLYKQALERQMRLAEKALATPSPPTSKFRARKIPGKLQVKSKWRSDRQRVGYSSASTVSTLDCSVSTSPNSVLVRAI